MYVSVRTHSRSESGPILCLRDMIRTCGMSSGGCPGLTCPTSQWPNNHGNGCISHPMQRRWTRCRWRRTSRTPPPPGEGRNMWPLHVRRTQSWWPPSRTRSSANGPNWPQCSASPLSRRRGPRRRLPGRRPNMRP